MLKDAIMEPATVMEHVHVMLVGLAPLATSNFAPTTAQPLLDSNLAIMERVFVMTVTLEMLVKTKTVLSLASTVIATLLLELATVM